MGEPQRVQISGSTWYIFAISRAHAALLSDEQTENSGLQSSCVSGKSGE
jgi:hypothetical protein